MGSGSLGGRGRVNLGEIGMVVGRFSTSLKPAVPSFKACSFAACAAANPCAFS
jgi:hypothetical protein